MSSNSCECGCRSCHMRSSFCITIPEQNSILTSLESVKGNGTPGCIVKVFIDEFAAIMAYVDCNGHWSAVNPHKLSFGEHIIFATECCGNCIHEASASITIRPSSITPPTIEFPANGSIIQDRNPDIYGQAITGYHVRVCLLGYGCITVPVDCYGTYYVNFNQMLPNGTYTITATQISQWGIYSKEVYSTFKVI